MARICVMTVALWFLPVLCWAEEASIDLPIDVEVPSALVVGKGQPFLKMTARKTVKGVNVTITRKGWRRQFRVPSLGAGRSKIFRWNERPGFYGYTVTVTAKRGQMMARQQLTFDLSYLPPITMSLSKSKVDLTRRHLTFQLNQPAKSAELEVKGPRGVVLARAEESYGGAAPGTPLPISWPVVNETITSIEITAHSTAGFWTGKVVTPWSVTIPHEDVAFETDRWKIRASEAPKIDQAIELIHKALREHGREFAVNLYVGGFTDTVGTKQHNRDLSQKRARAIAQYFARNKVPIPIFYRGFGEEALATNTPDNTDEPRNRRASYILSPQPPSLAKAVSWGGWQALR